MLNDASQAARAMRSQAARMKPLLCLLQADFVADKEEAAQS